MIDGATGSTWNFRFDWQRYHPDTTVFKR